MTPAEILAALALSTAPAALGEPALIVTRAMDGQPGLHELEALYSWTADLEACDLIASEIAAQSEHNAAWCTVSLAQEG